MAYPGGISAEAIEQRPGGDRNDGYKLTVFGNHDEDTDVLLAELDQLVWAETARCSLEHDHQSGWQVTGTQVTGRVRGDQDDASDAITNGHRSALGQQFCAP